MHSFNYLFPHEKTPEQKLRDRVGLVGEVLLGVGLVLLAPALLSVAAYATVGILTTAAGFAAAVLGPLLQIAGSVCLILIGGCAGYVAGGLSKSSLNHIDWDEESARKGLKNGLVAEAVVAAVVGGIACVMSAACTGAISGAWTGMVDLAKGVNMLLELEAFTIPFTGITFSAMHVITLAGVLSNDVNQLRASFLGLFFEKPLGLAWWACRQAIQSEERRCFVEGK